MLAWMVNFVLAVVMGWVNEPPPSAFAGQVIAVIDGDTLTVNDGSTHRDVRLAGIDAPELGQAFGDRSREELASMVLRRHVVVESREFDRHTGRVIGKVFVEGQDANLALVSRGTAWLSPLEASRLDTHDADRYQQSEQSARQQRVGLWGEAEPPQPPWEVHQRRRAALSRM